MIAFRGGTETTGPNGGGANGLSLRLVNPPRPPPCPRLIGYAASDGHYSDFR